MSQRLKIEEDIFSANNRLAEKNRAKLDSADVLALNFLASLGTFRPTPRSKGISSSGVLRIGVTVNKIVFDPENLSG